jgi:hypothetical protein
MDEGHLAAALRYVALNPVKAGLAARAQDWPRSSTGALVAVRSTRHVDVTPALARTGDFAAFLAGGGDEARLGLPLAPQRRGPKARAADDAEVSDQPTLDEEGG